MYKDVLNIFEGISSVVWGMPTVILLVGTGVLLSFRLKFFQLTKGSVWIRNTFVKIIDKNSHTSDDSNSLTPIQAICTALASTIGTGNIAGVAAAISIGGPGAVFWMWISAFFGMITSYSENTLGVFYRKRNNNGQWCGGPMIYIHEGLKRRKHISILSKPLSIAYSVFLIGASLGIGNMVQANTVSDSLKSTLNISVLFTGIIISAITYIIISGGLKRIGSLTEKIVPLMAIFYIVSTLYIFISNSENIPYVFSSITENAFSVKSVSGGIFAASLKKCISTGLKRGVFSNEAGLGASVTVSSCSSLKEPCEQGMWGIFGVFTDTIIICTLTAFAMLSTSVEAYNIDYAINNITQSPMYVYITSDEYKNKAVLPLADKSENNVMKIENDGGVYKITKTDKTTYTNIMKLSADFDKQKNIRSIKLEEVEGVSLISIVFKESFGNLSSIILSASIVLFSFSTIIGWYFYGAKAIEFLTKKNKTKKYDIIYGLSAFLGSVIKLDLVWTFSDILNALMSLPNLFALIALSEDVKIITDNYLRRLKKENIKPVTGAYEPCYLDTNDKL